MSDLHLELLQDIRADDVTVFSIQGGDKALYCKQLASAGIDASAMLPHPLVTAIARMKAVYHLELLLLHELVMCGFPGVPVLGMQEFLEHQGRAAN